MELKTLNYGTINYDENDIIVFERPLLGFEKLKKFVFVEFKENSMFSLLQSLDQMAIGFIVVSPFLIKEDYEIEIDENTIRELDLESYEDVVVVNTVTLSAIPEKITTNLRAPIIINIKKNKGKQIILTDDKYDIKTPLMEAR